MFDLIPYIKRQIAWSKDTFGDSTRTEGLCKHVELENKNFAREWAVQINPISIRRKNDYETM
jgi:hypothetical protein